eukprot:CAMPEP_0168177264 /NCGR_PEP_ID=MMETSP0139_2-20121125/8339_1 /TAXON_ID=44445 /ORGANISM="Pseudo-nitzschia australis, Strain 10249 10 AB" /LENGTH=273 /DNA_ID=CAMNT_0008096259 /DNA_START=108 /DNA_END=930 /DNA_ORIENTATION=-
MIPKQLALRILVAIGAVALACCSTAAAAAAAAEQEPTPDTHEMCGEWAERGECVANPDFMLSNCAASCAANDAAALRDAEELKQVSSFFDLTANDSSGTPLDFSRFEGKVTVLVNVASECGYTDSHYRGLVRLWNNVKHTQQINILAFPCDQFGHQEPGTSEEVHDFAVQKYGVGFTMMEKINVNGPNASIIYKFLKSEAGPKNIEWNFATYFVVSPDGAIHAHSNVEPMELKETLFGLLSTDDFDVDVGVGVGVVVGVDFDFDFDFDFAFAF